MAANLKDEFGTEPELIEGSGGVFEVTLNNELIFSKKQLGRFPTFDEIKKLVETA